MILSKFHSQPVGVTNILFRRVGEPKYRLPSSFTRKYQVSRPP